MNTVACGLPLSPLARHQDVGLRHAGFTLLELLVVISLISIIASVGIYSYDGTEDSTRLTTTYFEMTEIRKALLQFHKDTGEFPCRVYKDGDYVADRTAMGLQLDFSGLPATPTAADYQKWCSNGYEDAINTEQDNNALSMVRRFPYDVRNASRRDLLWNLDLHLGWNGPYLDKDLALKDDWGNNYRLLQPELDYALDVRCKINSTNNGYETSDGVYLCLPLDEVAELPVAAEPADYLLPANTARLVSLGPNGRFESAIDYSKLDPDNANYDPNHPCVGGGDDLVLCLLR